MNREQRNLARMAEAAAAAQRNIRWLEEHDVTLASALDRNRETLAQQGETLATLLARNSE